MKKTLLLFLTLTFTGSMLLNAATVKIIDENFQDWEGTSDSDPDNCEEGLSLNGSPVRQITVLTSNGEEEIDVKMRSCGISPTCDSKRVGGGSDGNPDISAGYVQFTKSSSSSFTFGPIPYIDSIRFGHSATGSNRGIRIYKSFDGEEWERATDDEFNSSSDSQAGDIRVVKFDEYDVYIKFTAGVGDDGITFQYSRLHSLEVFGEPGEIEIPDEEPPPSKVTSLKVENILVKSTTLPGVFKFSESVKQIQVFNMVGSPVTTELNNNTFSISKEAAGLYIIKGKLSNGEVFVQKVIKRK